MVRALAKLLPVLLVGGWSIQPLPQDYAGLDTYGIVAQIRCEMRSVLKRRVVNAVARREKDEKLANKVEDGSLPLSQLIRQIKDKDLKGVLEQYAGATILYDFSLNMTETDSATGGAGLTRPFTRGSDVVGFSVASDHKRQNTRTFVIEDTFEKLLTLTSDSYCSNYVDAPNYNYPVTGRTRLEDTVLTFLDLNQSGNLGTKPNGPKTPTITDDLQFTTKYVANVSPGFTVSPLGGFFQVTSANGKVESSREDLHRVTIVLAMPQASNQPVANTLAESRSLAQAALQNANDNRTRVSIDRIADRFSPSGL